MKLTEKEFRNYAARWVYAQPQSQVAQRILELCQYLYRHHQLQFAQFDVLSRLPLDGFKLQISKWSMCAWALESEMRGVPIKDLQLQMFHIVVVCLDRVVRDHVEEEAFYEEFRIKHDRAQHSLTNMGLKNKDGVELANQWKDGVNTYLGFTISGFPNMFMAYTPQASTALSSGPSVIEAQVETIADRIKKLEAEGAASIEPQREAEVQWKDLLDQLSKRTLFPFTDSWWNGASVPAKVKENMIFVGGVNVYEKMCREKLDGWKGFDVAAIS